MLPVTEKILNDDRGLLRNIQVIHINHEIDDIFEFNNLLKKDGAELFFIAIPYKKKPNIKLQYPNATFSRDRNLNYVPLICGKRHTRLKDKDLVPSILNVFVHVLEKFINPQKKLIVIQDGGYIALSHKAYQLKNFLGCVEQTESGATMFEKEFKTHKHKFPVITIARSPIKVQYESHFITQRVFEETNLLFYEINEFLKFKKIIIGGYGQIGRRLALLFRQTGTQVLIYDTNKKLQSLVEIDGLKYIQKIKSDHINESFCYIGCVGQRSFRFPELVQFLKSKKDVLYLVSASSKRIEFLDIIGFFEMGKRRNSDESIKIRQELDHITNIMPIKNSIGVSYHFNYKNLPKRIILLAEGAPVNFYRQSSNSVPSKAIDPIQALMMKSTLALIKTQNKIKNEIMFVGDPLVNKLLGIDEEKIMQDWAKLNGVTIFASDILTQFDTHPYYSKPSIKK